MKVKGKRNLAKHDLRAKKEISRIIITYEAAKFVEKIWNAQGTHHMCGNDNKGDSSEVTNESNGGNENGNDNILPIYENLIEWVFNTHASERGGKSWHKVSGTRSRQEILSSEVNKR